jgi:hypothetical protein
MSTRITTRLIGDLLDVYLADHLAPSHEERLRRHNLRSSIAVLAANKYLYPDNESRFAAKPHLKLCVYGLRVYAMPRISKV